MFIYAEIETRTKRKKRLKRKNAFVIFANTAGVFIFLQRIAFLRVLSEHHPPWQATNHAVFAGVASSIYFTIFVVLIVGEDRGVRLIFQHRVGPRFVANVIGSVTCWFVFRPWHLWSRSEVKLRSYGNALVFSGTKCQKASLVRSDFNRKAWNAQSWEVASGKHTFVYTRLDDFRFLHPWISVPN